METKTTTTLGRKTMATMRIKDPHLGTWMAPDPMAEKYPGMSPYLYCAGDPVNRVDPDGKDVWIVDAKGVVINHQIDNSVDAIYLGHKNEKGGVSRLQDESGEDIGVSFDYGTIEHQWSRSYKDGIDDIFVVRGDENGAQVFEFFANTITNTTDIEFSMTQTGEEGKKGIVFISTSHTINHEGSFGRLFHSQLVNGYMIRSHTHSHPHSMEPSKTDIALIECYNGLIKESGRRPMLSYIYYSKSKTSLNNYVMY